MNPPGRKRFQKEQEIAAGIDAVIRFGQAEAADHLEDQRRQVARLLLGRAVGEDR